MFETCTGSFELLQAGVVIYTGANSKIVWRYGVLYVIDLNTGAMLAEFPDPQRNITLVILSGQTQEPVYCYPTGPAGPNFVGTTTLTNINGLIGGNANYITPVTLGSGIAYNNGTLSFVGSGTGTVTSVALTVPNFLTVSGSPVTTAGTLAVSLNSESAGTFFAGPATGSGQPTFRAILPTDVPTLNQNTTGQAGTVATIAGLLVAGTNVTLSGSGNPYTINASGSLPSGVIVPFAGTTSPPSGWLNCDGSAQSRTTYASLFSAIGTTYGAGDGSTTFNLPNMQGRTAIGTGSGGSTTTVTSYNSTTNSFNVPANTDSLITGMTVVLSCTGTVKSGYTIGGTYYIYRNSATNVYLCSSLNNAVAGTPVSAGTGSFTGTITLVGSLQTRTLGQVGGEEKHVVTFAELPNPGANPVSVTTTIAVDTVSDALGANGARWDGMSVLGGQDGGDNSIISPWPGQLTYGTGPGYHNNMQPYLGLTWIIKT